MDLTLEPFGYLKTQNKLVDVHQVPSGKRCGCQCPSCHAPLIARKGHKKIWHFAHDSKSEITTKLKKCSYSFFVSARLMSLQLIDDQLSILLPKFEITLSEHLPMSERAVQVSEIVTESSRVTMEKVTLDAEIAGHKIDILGYVNGYRLAIAFSHPGRNIHWQKQDMEDEKIGVLEISLDALKDRFRALDSTTKSYSEVLKDYLSNDVASKKWIFHPRLHHSESIAKSKLSARIAKARKQPIARLRKPKVEFVFDDRIFKELKDQPVDRTKNTKYTFTCQLCNSTWSGIGNDQASCRKCGTSLLVSRTSAPEN